MKSYMLSTRLLAIVLAILMVPPAEMWAAVSTEPVLPDPGNVGVSKQQQEQLGLKAAGEVYQQMPVLPDSSAVTQYVQQLGRRLVAVIPPDKSWPYQFHVVQQKDINAFALPGGPIFINVGTITAADNEAELAGVMAHEMSHVYMQHSIKGMEKEQMTQGIAGLLGGILGSVIGGAGGALANLGAQQVGGLLSLRYSRKDEAQADAVGAIIMYKAGFDPRALPQFFQKLEQTGGPGGPQFLSDHPNPGNRVEAIDKEIANWPHKNLQENNPAFPVAKQEAMRVQAYSAQEIAQGAKSGRWAQENRKNGAIPANVPVSSTAPAGGASASDPTLANVTYQQVKPSKKYARFNQGGISIQYPSNWKAATSQSEVTIAPPAGASQNGIAYGVVIGASQDPNSGDLDQGTQNLMQSLQQSNPGLQPSGNMKTINVAGTQGRSVDMMGNSPIEQNGKPLPEHDWLVTVPSPQGGLVFQVFIAPERDFSRLRPTYEHMLNSLQLQ
ncbi:MAG TPA: M48 family metallopeptidase [Terriglobales bacterium]|nr:M48 family metallopeptidase [Terriglobales bacterium]